MLPYSKEAYLAFLEGYGTAVWPLQVAGLVAGVIAAALVLKRNGGAKAGLLLLAGAWVAVAVGFYLLNYSGLNWAGPVIGGLFGFQALLLAMTAYTADTGGGACGRRVGLAIALFALVVHPALEGLARGAFAAIQMFATSPGPTVVLTLGLQLISGGRTVWYIFPVPVLWSVIATGRAASMEDPFGLVLPAVAIAAAAWGIVARRRSRPV